MAIPVQALGAGETILWAAVLGLLIGIVWSLKYIVIIDRKLDHLLYLSAGRQKKLLREEERELRILKNRSAVKRRAKPKRKRRK